MNWGEILINNIIPTCILILVIVILVYNFREHYVGSPLSNLLSWDSGSVLRRMGSQFSATNQGQTVEGMTGGREAPYYMAPWQANADYTSNVSGTDYSSTPLSLAKQPPAASSTSESYYSGNRSAAGSNLAGYSMEDKRLAHSLY